ncbi:lipid-A-disaccharide synthase [Consotaella salsifontis]|uniref:Lipid-A-disaccharide synthase n=1 Tax=Consotaella salsifontis TaxID=1365950 RepID=A0A1T4SZW5_9HYPH|nr:lipid-A-disaccharide synthase [Consotaella salsifontis]SKA33672.1 lipid-A-disaccharide synthase [Consotaella salsifontis]
MTTIAFIVGEESGDRLGADLIRALRHRLPDFRPIGLGGEAMAGEGVTSLFDISELSIIGIGAVLARLPQLLVRIRQTADWVVEQRPDALVIIDSPDFSHRVARQVRARNPRIPIINYMPPTVWAWRPRRAAKMRPYVDHAICALPFEPSVLAELGGPPATYVGHPLVYEPHLQEIAARVEREGPCAPASPPRLVVLPGSRRGEIRRLGAIFGQTLSLVKTWRPDLDAVLPTLPRRRKEVETAISDWPYKPPIVIDEEAKWRAFANADAALAASGTVSLELALADVPMVLAYRLDPVGYHLRHLVTAWTAALPNFIAGHPLVPEHFHEFARPETMARRLMRLIETTPERAAQVAGFAEIRRRMHVERPPGEAAAEIVLDCIERNQSRPQ